jgi:hypothetical protein
MIIEVEMVGTDKMREQVRVECYLFNTAVQPMMVCRDKCSWIQLPFRLC